MFVLRRVAVGKLTMSQVDPAVFAELPPEVAAELAAALPPSHASFFSVGNIPPDPGSPLPSGADAAAAAQGCLKAKAAAKVQIMPLLKHASSTHRRLAQVTCERSCTLSRVM